MRLFILIAFTMTAFAANSILTRLAVENGYVDPSSFALIRVLAGAVVLSIITMIRKGKPKFLDRSRAIGASSLAAYIVGFSLAYQTLDAGLGALILFGVVQIFMFVYSSVIGVRPTLRQIGGAAVAFAGLLFALWPVEGGQSDPAGAGLMIIAGIGWAIYTISGRKAVDPLAATTTNFILCLPLLAIFLFSFITHASLTGWVLAIICGGITSGLGYALWYSILPRLQGNTAAIVQLSVPIIALLGGAIFLGEPVTPIIFLATALVVIGIAVAITSRSAPGGRK